MVSLEFFKDADFPYVNYILDEFQSKYTSTAEFALNRIATRNSGLEFPVTIFENDSHVGFFCLDFGEDKLALTDNENATLLRSLSINPLFQGKGIGKSAMMKADQFIKENFKNCDEIVLTVNEDNSLAFDLYLKVGYHYNGKTNNGRNGLQYIMNKKL